MVYRDLSNNYITKLSRGTFPKATSYNRKKALNKKTYQMLGYVWKSVWLKNNSISDLDTNLFSGVALQEMYVPDMPYSGSASYCCVYYRADFSIY